MCGILGVINYHNTNCKEALNTIIHRGPDYNSSFTFNNVWLGHTRLSIIDLSANANQPTKYNKDYALVFNGEIYNYKELGKKYLNKDFISDTIFLYELLIKYNNNKVFEIIKEFRGMWAFAFFDVRKNQILLIRDLFGKKPLYYYIKNNTFIFASEIKPIKYILDKELYYDEIVLQEVIKYRFSNSDSPYINIDMLKKGHYGLYDIQNNTFKVSKYFDVFDLISNNTPFSFSSDNVSRIDNILNDSIAFRTVSDVSIGSIVSGGLDSSLIAAMTHRINNNAGLFHVNVENSSETKYALSISKKLGTKLNIYNFTNKDFIDNYERALNYYEYPMVHPNNIALLGLSKLSHKKNTKVLLSGEGADEIFGGYSNALLINKFLGFFSLLLIKNKKFAFLLSEIFNFNLKKFLLISPKEDNFLPVELEMEKVFSKYYKYYSDFYKKQNALYASFLAIQFEFYTKPLLLRADKMFMANSVELRSPFFDTQVVKHALLTHPKLRRSKKIIAKVAENYIDYNIIYRKKFGFSIPYYKALNYKKVYKNDELNFIFDSFYRLKY